MARKTVRIPAVIKSAVTPGICAVAASAWPWVMLYGRVAGMASAAHGLPIVSRIFRRPIINTVTTLALVVKMIGRGSVAGGTAREVLMGHPGLHPDVGEMTGRTLPRVMPHRSVRTVAAQTIRLVRMVKGHVLPGFRAVAVGA